MKKIALLILFTSAFILSACGERVEILEVRQGDAIEFSEANSIFSEIDDNGNLVEAE